MTEEIRADSATIDTSKYRKKKKGKKKTFKTVKFGESHSQFIMELPTFQLGERGKKGLKEI